MEAVDKPESGVIEITRRMEARIGDLIPTAQALDDMQVKLRDQVAQRINLRDRARNAIQAQIVPDETFFGWWTLKSMNADELHAAYAGNLIGVGEEQRYFQRQRNQIDRSELSTGQTVFLQDLDQIVSGPDGLFEQRRQGHPSQLPAQNAVFPIRRGADGLNAEASAFAAFAEGILT